MVDKRRVLVLGVSGMLGNAVFRVFASSPDYDVWGSARSAGVLRHLEAATHPRIVLGVDVENSDHLLRVVDAVRPFAIVNCVGLVKQLAEAKDPLAALPINAILPHRLARIAALVGARLVHVSTDCVFSGAKGAYKESDQPDATDLYGRSKLLGEVDYPHAITLRTSIIGHELGSAHGLIGWFLEQQGTVRGYTRAIFSGLPTVELARVIRDHVLSHAGLSGLYHVSAAPIAKHDLLALVAAQYRKDIRLEPDDRLEIDRSLNSDRFRAATAYEPPSWPELVRRMHEFG